MAAMAYDDLRARISADYERLSKRLRQIAEFALDNPNDMALETVAVIAERADVQPSSLIRFAKAFGFDGFSEMQRVFRSRLVDRTPSYTERIRSLEADTDGGFETPSAVLGHFADAGIHALEHLKEEIRPEAMERALDLLLRAESIHVVGQRRAFPVVAYLAYGLSHLDRRTHLIDGVGGLTFQQASVMTDRDTLLAVSFEPYAPETLAVARQASERGVPVVAITDGPLSPLVPLSRVAFEVQDAQVKAFRALTASMCLALSLVVALGQRITAAGRSEG